GGDAAVLVAELALDVAGAVVVGRAAGARGRAPDAPGGAVVAAEAVLEAGRGVDRGRVGGAGQREVDVGALVAGAVVVEGRRRGDVVDGHVGRVAGDAAVLVAELALDVAGAVVVGRAAGARGRAPGAPGGAVVAAEAVLEAGRGVDRGRVGGAGQREVDVGALVAGAVDRKSTRLNSGLVENSYAVGCVAKVIVADLALDVAGAVVVGRAAGAR